MSVTFEKSTSETLRYFKVQLHTVNSAGNRPVRYTISDAGQRQPRLQKRFVIKPVIDLSRYRVEALIDYLTVHIELREPSQGHVLHRKLDPLVSGSVRVDPIGDNPSSATRFSVMFNEPKRYEVERALRVLEATKPFVDPPLIETLEVSVDWYPRTVSQTLESLEEIAGVLQKHLVPPRFDFGCSLAYPRVVYPGTNSGGTPISRWRKLIGGTAAQPKYFPTYVDGTNYVGQKGSSAMWRIMIKTTDKRRSATDYSELPPEKWRTRSEVVLNRSTLREFGLSELGDLNDFQFERLRKKYFSHWFSTIPNPNIEFPRCREDVKRMLSAFRLAGGLAAYREELAVLHRSRKRLASGRGSREALKQLKQIERTLSRERGYRLDYRDLNGKIEAALRSLRW